MSDQAYTTNNFNDDFEKVDPDNSYGAEQDESVTSSSMPGEMAEEDRYTEPDLLGDFSVGSSVPVIEKPTEPAGQPLISFGDSSPEPSVTASAPPKPEPSEPKTAIPTEGLKGIPGVEKMCCWMKTVDPRDEVNAMSDPTVTTMDEQPTPSESADLSASAATTTAAAGPGCGVLEIIYWRDVKTTGVVFGSMMFVLLSLSLCSLMSVLAYLSLAILTVTFSFRVYKSVMQAVQKTNDGHPFKKLLDLDLQLKEDVVQAAAQKIADNINNCSAELRRLYLVGDYIDSLKFGLLLWLLTYVGAWFDGMTLVILVVVSIFTLPKVYETYQGPIDQNVNLVRGQLNNIMAQVSAKIPFPKKKAKTQ